MNNFVRKGHTAGNYGTFYQLQPSKNFQRYLATYESATVSKLKDVWGTKKTIKMINNTAKKWVEDGNSIFYVGDISLYNGGYFSPHSSHQDGTGVDIGSAVICDISKAGFNREKAKELALLFINKGATRLLFNCKYVVDSHTKVYAVIGHHHHFHVDTKASSALPHPELLCAQCKKSTYDACPTTVRATRTDAELTP